MHSVFTFTVLPTLHPLLLLMNYIFQYLMKNHHNTVDNGVVSLEKVCNAIRINEQYHTFMTLFLSLLISVSGLEKHVLIKEIYYKYFDIGNGVVSL